MPSTEDYASVKLTHHALLQERREGLRRGNRGGAKQPECLAVGHAWTEDAAREGGTICVVCHVVRWP